MQIDFFAPGTPKAQPRPRAFARKMGNTFVARVYDAGTAEGWKGCIAMAAREQAPEQPLEGPLCVDIDFIFPRPQCLMRKKDPEGRIWHTARIDRDNLDKAVLDCLKTLRFFLDDGQACDGRIRKCYAAKTEPSGAFIRITQLQTTEPQATSRASSEAPLFATT